MDHEIVMMSEEDYEAMVADIEYLDAVCTVLTKILEENGIPVDLDEEEIWRIAREEDNEFTN